MGSARMANNSSLPGYAEGCECGDDDIAELTKPRSGVHGLIGFETLKDFVGRRDAEAVKASKTILDQGDTLADGFTDL